MLKISYVRASFKVLSIHMLGINISVVFLSSRKQLVFFNIHATKSIIFIQSVIKDSDRNFNHYKTNS